MMAAPRNRLWVEGYPGLIFLIAIDLLILFDAFALGYLFRFQWGFLLPPLDTAAPPVEYLKAWGVAAYLSLLLFHAYGLYDLKKSRDPFEVLEPLLRAGGWALLLVLSLSYFYREFSYSRMAVAYSCGVALLLLGTFRTSYQAYGNHLRRRGEYRKPIVLVGSRTVASFLARRIEESSEYGMKVVAVADDDFGESRAFESFPTGSLADVSRLIDEHRAEAVIVGHQSLEQRQLFSLLESCENRGIPIRMVPATYDLLVDESDIQEVGGIPLVGINERRPRPTYRALKRVLDLIGALLGLIGLAPVLAAIALAIRLDSPGPVIYRQRRVGRGGNPFVMFKFRTMVENAETLLEEIIDVDALPEPVFKLEKDPRTTRVGRFLRRFGLDELPQLFNVLRGEMSLVGPRPEEEAIVARYDTWERRRLKLKPGITGLQQLRCRGSNSLRERVQWDIVYFRRESLLFDLWILFRTIGVVLKGKGNH